MSDHIRQTIADLQAKLREQEATVSKTKATINQLCEVAGLPAIYADVTATSINSGGGNSIPLTIRSDQFYGRPLATCTKEILDMRRKLDQGPATVNELYDALLEGGFKYETKNAENAKRNLRISISKNTALFHKLPNGKIGLTEWYPKIKKSKQDEDPESEEGGEP